MSAPFEADELRELEQRLTERLETIAPRPRLAAGERVRMALAATPQRHGLLPWLRSHTPALAWTRLLAVSATAVVALAIGIGIGRSVLTTTSRSPTATPSVSVHSLSASPSSQLLEGGTLEWIAGQSVSADTVRSVALWGAQYVAIATRGNAPVILVSPDGAHWIAKSFFTSARVQIPRFLFALHDRLVEIGEQPIAACPAAAVAPCVEGAPQILISHDGGGTWTSPESSSWSTLFSTAELIDVADGLSGLVAIGVGHGGAPIVAHSLDGITWQPASRTSFVSAVFRAVIGYKTGFAILGREGTQDSGSGGVGQPGSGTPAAWWSSDGEIWSRSTVEGPSGQGAELSWGLAGRDGLFAMGKNLDPGAAGAAGWSSSDGKHWHRAGQVTGAIPYGIRDTSNGRVMFILGPRRLFAPADDSLGAWISVDGKVWSQVAMTGEKAQLPAGESSATAGAIMDSVFAVPNGLVVFGQENGKVMAWFGAYHP